MKGPPEPLRDLSPAGRVGLRLGRELVQIIAEQPADGVELRRLDPDRPEQALEGKLDQFLGSADDVGARVFITERRERLPRTCRWSQREDFARLQVRLELPVPGVSEPDAARAQHVEPAPEVVHVSPKEAQRA
jgi:hypothetical protein